MKRSIVHCTFATVALVCGGLVAYHALRLHQINRTNSAIASARISEFDADVPEARFARALAFARSGESEAAIKAYKALLESERRDLRQAALYNLGNLYMRDALANGASQAFRSLPLIELAKQRYREALRNEPSHWDARYNLSRALQLAPELEQELEEKEEPPKREQSPSTLQGARIDLP
jgi:mxaK protein